MLQGVGRAQQRDKLDLSQLATEQGEAGAQVDVNENNLRFSFLYFLYLFYQTLFSFSLLVEVAG